MRDLKRVLASLMILGAASLMASTGTFASLNAQVLNRSDSISTGTLTVNTSVTPSGGTQTTCLSYTGTDDSNAHTGCGSFLNTGSSFFPGQSTTAAIQVENSGSLPAGTLEVYMSSCSLTSGSGNPCSQVQVYLEETTSTGTYKSCWYGGSSCAFSSSDTLSTFQAYTWNSTYNIATPLVLTGGLAAQATRYFVLGFSLPSTVANTYQSAVGQISFTWAVLQ